MFGFVRHLRFSVICGQAVIGLALMLIVSAMPLAVLGGPAGPLDPAQEMFHSAPGKKHVDARQTLSATLRAHEMDAADLQQIIQSPTVDPILDELLHSDDPNVVKFTLGLIHGRPIGQLSSTFEKLLNCPFISADVNCMAPAGDFIF